MLKIRVGVLAGVPSGGSVTEYDTTGLHPVEFGEVPKSSTNFLRGEAPVRLDERSGRRTLCFIPA
jgi:hypothetical protein